MKGKETLIRLECFEKEVGLIIKVTVRKVESLFFSDGVRRSLRFTTTLLASPVYSMFLK